MDTTIGDTDHKSGIQRIQKRRERQMKEEVQRRAESNGQKNIHDVADEFAAVMNSPDCQMDAQAAVIWFSRTQDDGKKPVKDLSYYSRLTNYPQPTDYPTLPAWLFDRPPSAECCERCYESLASGSDVRREQALIQRQEAYLWRHSVIVDFHGLEITGIGQDTTQELARIAATIHLLHQLHENDILRYVLIADSIEIDQRPPSPESEDLQSSQIVREGFTEHLLDLTSKFHVYNYAARFGLIPMMNSHVEFDGTVTTNVSLPDLGLEVRASGKDENESEALACRQFKEEAERKHSQKKKLNPLDEPINLQKPGAVSLDNARDILAYYESTHSPDTFFCEVQPAQPLVTSHDSVERFSAIMYWQGQIITPPCVMLSASRAKFLSALITAVTLTRREPGLVAQFEDSFRQTGGAIPSPITPLHLKLGRGTESFLEEIVEAVDQTPLPELSDRPFDPMDYKVEIAMSQQKFASAIRSRKSNHFTNFSLEARGELLKSKYDVDLLDPRAQERKALSRRLPVNKHKAEILGVVKNHMQCMVVGTAGSGKSTQVPQMIFEAAIADGRGAFCNILHTQPRRAAAVEIALRISYERNEELGEAVGYTIGGDVRFCRNSGSITLCTSELLLLQLEHNPDEILNNISHIIIDEVHERDIPTNQLLMILKLAYSARLERGESVPKLILMSATLESELFEKYFEVSDAAGGRIRPPVITVPGRQFEVKHTYLESLMPDMEAALPRSEFNLILKHPLTALFLASELGENSPLSEELKSDSTSPLIQWESKLELDSKTSDHILTIGLIAAAIAYVIKSTDSGDILVFLTGWREMTEAEELLRQRSFMGLNFNDPGEFEILRLHSANPEAIAEASEAPPDGCRRILLATSIAEASHTFAYVKYIIDGGKIRRPGYSGTSVEATMYRNWVSRANSTQRAGRVGRVQPGHYFALFSRRRLNALSSFPEAQGLALGRVQKLCLRARWHFPMLPLRIYFSRLLDAPPARYIQAAVSELKDLGAMTLNDELTDIGRALARLGLQPAVGKMILLGILFRCLDPLLVVAASLERSHTVFGGHDLDDKAAEEIYRLRPLYAQGSRSDIFVLINIFSNYLNVKGRRDVQGSMEWAAENHLQHERLEDLKVFIDHLRFKLKSLNYLRLNGDEYHVNARSGNQGLVKALIMVGMHPNLAIHKHDFTFHTRFGKEADMWQGSVARPVSYQPGQVGTNPLNGSVCCYTDLKQLSPVFKSSRMSNMTLMSPLAVALFGNSLRGNESDGTLVADDWIPLQVEGSQSAAISLLEFKTLWDRLVGLGMQRMCNPKLRGGPEIPLLDLSIQTIADLLEYDERKWQKKMNVLDKAS